MAAFHVDTHSSSDVKQATAHTCSNKLRIPTGTHPVLDFGTLLHVLSEYVLVHEFQLLTGEAADVLEHILLQVKAEDVVRVDETATQPVLLFSDAEEASFVVIGLQHCIVLSCRTHI